MLLFSLRWRGQVWYRGWVVPRVFLLGFTKEMHCIPKPNLYPRLYPQYSLFFLLKGDVYLPTDQPTFLLLHLFFTFDDNWL